MAARLLTRFLIRMVVSFLYDVVFCDRLLVSLAVRVFTHAARLVDTTDATSNRPVMMLMTSEVTFARRRALASTPMRSTPGITPCSAPRRSEERRVGKDVERGGRRLM